MLSPSLYSPPWSLHCCMRIFHCWKQYCRSSSHSLVVSSVTFTFTASTDSNLFPFNADLIFGNKKSHMGLGQVSTVDVPTWWPRASSKSLDRQGVVCWHIVLVLQLFRSSHPFMKFCQNFLVVDLVNGLTFRHPIQVNNPSDVNKTIIIALNLDLLCSAFFCLGELELFQRMDWRLLSGSYWKTLIHHKLLSSLNVWFVFNVLKNISTNVHSNFLLFRSEESRHHLRTHFFHVEIVM